MNSKTIFSGKFLFLAFKKNNKFKKPKCLTVGYTPNYISI